MGRARSRFLASVLCGLLATALWADQSDTARKLFRETKARADRGEAEAQLTVGSMYATGVGTSVDLRKAVKYHQKAAEQGLAPAQYQLALDYARGQGVKEDKAEAADWHLKAANQGLVEAEVAVGLCYLHGEGVKVDGAEALSWFRKAAAQGSAQAEYQIGKCYMEGIGAPRELAEGVKWIRHAAEAGYPPAQNYLASLYEKGNGVQKDEVQAYKWFALAAAQDDAHATEIRISLAKLESILSKEQVAEAQRSAREFKPSRGGTESATTSNPRATEAAGETALVMVNAQDEDAEVFSDGVFSGTSPARLKLKTGRHVIEVKKAGCKTYRREISVTAGSELNLRVHLEKEP